MRPIIIIITGRAAAGKTTLAKWLSHELKFPLVSKDNIREELFERLGWKDREWAQVLGKASVDMMFYFAKAELEVGRSIIMDNTFNPVLSVPRFNDLMNQYDAISVQIICDAKNEILFERFKARAESGSRHPGHGDETILKGFWGYLTSGYSSFLDIGSAIINVDTTDFAKVDYREILKKVNSFLQN